MIFTPADLAGAYVIDIDPHEDDRGFFARTWCRREFETHGLDPSLVQCSISFNKRRGTLRGMHFQIPPFEEAKIIRCTMGAIHDVIIDLRVDSRTFRQHLAVTLSAQNHRVLYVPAGFAHGFQTIEDNTEVSYQMSEFYSPDYSRGVRWNDPAFRIQWPVADPIMTDRDRNYPDFTRDSTAS
jgi:dTDP-4-dehydrorhamnose 3,5-epimerase